MAESSWFIYPYFRSHEKISKTTILAQIEEYYYIQGNGSIFTKGISKIVCSRRSIVMVEAHYMVYSYIAGLFCKPDHAIIF